MTAARPHLQNGGAKWSCVEQRVVEFIGRHLMTPNVRGRFPEVIQHAAEKGDPRRSRVAGAPATIRQTCATNRVPTQELGCSPSTT